MMALLETVTKKHIVDSILREIANKATRKDRACKDQDVLIVDLDGINRCVKNIQEVRAMDQDTFTNYEWEKMELRWFSDALDAM